MLRIDAAVVFSAVHRNSYPSHMHICPISPCPKYADVKGYMAKTAEENSQIQSTVFSVTAQLKQLQLEIQVLDMVRRDRATIEYF